MSQPRQLLGVHHCTIDPEGRIQIPVALRDELNPRAADFRLMVNLEPDGSLCLREKEDWDAWMSKLTRRRATLQRERRTLLFLGAHASLAKCDKSGRVRIPDSLLHVVGVDRADPDKRDVVLVGGFDEIRVWSPEGWGHFSASVRDDFGPALDSLFGGLAADVASEEGAG